MANSMGLLFLRFSALAGKTFAGRSQAAYDSTAKDSIRGGKACTKRQLDFDQSDCDARGPLRGESASVGSIQNQWEARLQL
jgi:hypothetical protein